MENKPVRRRPPRTLQIPAKSDESQGEDQKADSASARPARSRNRNSALIEKLQSNLALSPAALLPSPKSPGLRLQPPGFSPNCPSSPVSPTPGADKKEEESPASFESPADGALLPSINKSRARLSVRRRPPSRRVKKSGSEEIEAEEGDVDSSSLPTVRADGGTEETHTAETHTDDPGGPGPSPGPEANTTSTEDPRAGHKAQTQVKSQGKVHTAAAEDDGAVETSTADREEAEKSPTEAGKQDSTPETKAPQDTDKTSSVQEGPSREEDKGCQE
ncbi:duboraya isoform X2 [Clupea harengus]|uniref:Duboraya isoform X2 n=1 Tax=Clupea harengus TaxID=7950 RepID=A0A6P3W361_CLUHA|nr:duboraya isoform X2 [Clupea harengus]